MHQPKKIPMLKPFSPAFSFFCGLLLCGATTFDAQGAGGIETAGDILQYVLPAAAAGLTIGYWDGKGALEFGESAGVTLAATYALKYAVNEKRPNGGRQSFPS